MLEIENAIESLLQRRIAPLEKRLAALEVLSSLRQETDALKADAEKWRESQASPPDTEASGCATCHRPGCKEAWADAKKGRAVSQKDSEEYDLLKADAELGALVRQMHPFVSLDRFAGADAVVPNCEWGTSDANGNAIALGSTPEEVLQAALQVEKA